jgi:hypothetical protein
MDSKDRSRRRAERSRWPVSSFPLGDEPSDDLSESTTATQRIAMMWPSPSPAGSSLAGPYRRTGVTPFRPAYFLRPRGRRTTMTLEGLNDDFRDLLVELADAGVEFVIVGAYALVFHGAPRASASSTKGSGSTP